jgi:hypothetical protein
VSEITDAQSNALALTRANPESGGSVVHASATDTLVVLWCATSNTADPAHVTLPSVDLPEIEMSKPSPAGTLPTRKRIASLF